MFRKDELQKLGSEKGVMEFPIPDLKSSSTEEHCYIENVYGDNFTTEEDNQTKTS